VTAPKAKTSAPCIFFAASTPATTAKEKNMKRWLVIAITFIVSFPAFAQTPAPNLVLPTISAPELSDYLTRLAQDISSRTNIPIHCAVNVIESDSINAYALSSGEIYITRGLIQAVSNEAEIVFVMAQQLSYLHPHASTYAARTAFKKPKAAHTLVIGLISGALIVFGGPVGARAGAFVIAQEIKHRASLRYSSRQTVPASFIIEADKFAVEYLHEAGYDPEAALSLLAKLREMRPKNHVRQSELPPPPITFIERLRLVRKRISKLERKTEYLLDSSTFQELKNRLDLQPKPALSKVSPFNSNARP
jgi:predicted Zn-dependent protease